MESPATALMKGDYQSMYSALSTVIRRHPVTVQPDAPLMDALQAMQREGVGSIVVVDSGARGAIGIFTLQDLLRRVALRECDMSVPISRVMTKELVTLRPQATAYQAALAMERHGFRHVIVADQDGRLRGVVSQNDLFELQRAGVKEVSGDIRAARDLEGLRQAAVGKRGLAHNMLAQGVRAEQLSHFLSTLNDLLTIRLIELTSEEFELPQVKWCWIALGSEGRYEQTFNTDQDNGIIFEAQNDLHAAEVRNAFVPFAKAINARLDACGFPYCKGNIMAGNPSWCLSRKEWEHTFLSWIQEAQPQALLNAAIFFDFRALFGHEELADALREWLLSHTVTAPIFLRQMVQNALLCQPPLGVLRDFIFDDSKEFPRTIDLKMYGSRPFVDAARILALAKSVGATSTAERLRIVSERMNLGEDDVSAIIDAFFFVHMLRMRNQDSLIGPVAAANRLDPDELNELDRQILKGAFKQARKLQNRLALDYRL